MTSVYNGITGKTWITEALERYDRDHQSAQRGITTAQRPQAQLPSAPLKASRVRPGAPTPKQTNNTRAAALAGVAAALKQDSHMSELVEKPTSISAKEVSTPTRVAGTRVGDVLTLPPQTMKDPGRNSKATNALVEQATQEIAKDIFTDRDNLPKVADTGKVKKAEVLRERDTSQGITYVDEFTENSGTLIANSLPNKLAQKPLFPNSGDILRQIHPVDTYRNGLNLITREHQLSRLSEFSFIYPNMRIRSVGGDGNCALYSVISGILELREKSPEKLGRLFDLLPSFKNLDYQSMSNDSFVRDLTCQLRSLLCSKYVESVKEVYQVENAEPYLSRGVESIGEDRSWLSSNDIAILANILRLNIHVCELTDQSEAGALTYDFRRENDGPDIILIRKNGDHYDSALFD